MGSDMLAELAHLFFLEAAEARTEREMRYLLKIKAMAAMYFITIKKCIA